MTVEELRAKLQTNSYTTKTEQQMQEEAQARYKGTYDQQRLSAQQGYDTTAQALKNQLSTLGAAYDRQKREAQQATDLAISAADRRSLGRGMQRSSYNAATLGNIASRGNETLADIQADRTAAENDIAERQALASQQLQEQLANLDNTYAADVQAAIDALREQEYVRQNEAAQYNNNLLLQLYEMDESAKANDLARRLQEEQLKASQLENELAAANAAKANELAIKLQEEELRAAQLANQQAAAKLAGSTGGGSAGGGSGNSGSESPGATDTPPAADEAAAMNLLGKLGGLGTVAPSNDLLSQLNTALKNQSKSAPAKKNSLLTSNTSTKDASSVLAGRRNSRRYDSQYGVKY